MLTCAAIIFFLICICQKVEIQREHSSLSVDDIFHLPSLLLSQLCAHDALLSLKTISLCLSDAYLRHRRFTHGDRPLHCSDSMRKEDLFSIEKYLFEQRCSDANNNKNEIKGSENTGTRRYRIHRCFVSSFTRTTVVIRHRRIGFIEKVSIDDSRVQRLWTAVIFEVDILPKTSQLTFHEHNRLLEERPGNSFRTGWCG